MLYVVEQPSLLDSSLSMTMNISLARFAKVALSTIRDAIMRADIPALGGFDGIKMLLDLNCYEPSVTKGIAG